MPGWLALVLLAVWVGGGFTIGVRASWNQGRRRSRRITTTGLRAPVRAARRRLFHRLPRRNVRYRRGAPRPDRRPGPRPRMVRQAPMVDDTRPVGTTPAEEKARTDAAAEAGRISTNYSPTPEWAARPPRS
jgi:hypothetical protein